MRRIPLPIDGVLPEVSRAARDGAFVLVAAPGAGKTTRVPPALAEQVQGAVWVLEPRRVAARAAARRMAEEAGQPPGARIGWHVRFDRRASAETRVLVVTEGILLRRLQEDPFLEGVGAVLVDEFHERSLLADLALALLAEVRAEARPDLVVGVMSATLDAEPVAAFLGGAAVIRASGREFPITIVHDPRGESLDVEDAVAGAVADALDRQEGDVLAFLPGVREIRRAMVMLSGIDAQVVPLHGGLSAAEQDRALRPGEGRRVVLATNLAETSVTVPGVRIVVDGGFVRRPRFDAGTGLDRLVTVRISQASAEQRAGRAGRTAPGVAVRLWSERVHRGLVAWDPPEVRQVDLAGAALQLLTWGTDPARFGWFEAPPAPALAAARLLLDRLGATHGGHPTVRGRAWATWPLHPRLAALLWDGAERGVAHQAAVAAALLAEGSLRPPERDYAADSDVLEAVHDPAPLAPHLVRVVRQLESAAPPGPRNASESPDVALRRAVLAGWPDRLARRRGPASDRARMVGGRGVRLDRRSVVRTAELFVAVDVDDALPEGRVRVASAVEEAWLDVEKLDVLVFDDAAGAVQARRVRRVGDLELASHPIRPDPVDAAALLAVVAAGRLSDAIPPDPEFAQLRARLAFVHGLDPDRFPAPDDTWLGELLPGLCAGRRSLDELRRAGWDDAIQGALGWNRWAALQELAPERLTLPSGRRQRVHWEEGRPPVLAVPMQDLFGQTRTPTVGGGRVPVLLHLLAPNGRPQQITDDLAGFWARTWTEVRKELRARYPKHAWPEDPLTAPPGRRRHR